MDATLLIRNTEDYQYFGELLNYEDVGKLSSDEQKEREIMTLLLKVKNGTLVQSEQALMELTDKAQEFGARPLFLNILPLLMRIDPIRAQERLLIVKALAGVLSKLDESVGPFAHKILVLIEPMLIEENDNARMQGKEVIFNLSKEAGLAYMIAAMRPDIDNVDEDVRKMTAIAFSVVASALGVPVVLPFLKGVCQSKKSWEARQTGMKIVQEIALVMGSEVVPYLTSLVEIIGHGLDDENQKVRSITAISLAALAKAAAPNGIERIESLLGNLQV